MGQGWGSHIQFWPAETNKCSFINDTYQQSNKLFPVSYLIQSGDRPCNIVQWGSKAAAI